ncbi:MAG: branched-chain amino acid aminotransferase [Sphingobacteriia bacterium]|nr:MAG: branched-chain amino acid aminotransferase [Sphingobacteriia bacterium]TAG30017.1 MAG: branched-chain amino acid aminotransferase [Sphingobacteriia bacterium]
MHAVLDINITPIVKSKLADLNLENIPFGKYFTDHMLVADYSNGVWKNVEIKPYAPLMLEPSLAALHYGQSIFEGIKAYKLDNGEVAIFRPDENFKRFNLSATRMQMPTVPEEIFIEGMRKLIHMDQDWIPSLPDHSMYIRPFMFATDAVLGVKPSDSYKFIILLSPTGPYFSTPMRIYVEEKYTRAVSGGVGFSKNAGNYGASMYPTSLAKEIGYDQVLWTDAFEHKYLQEVGMMNVFFIIGNQAITPSLEEGTILSGITRMSALVLLAEMGLEVVEKKISIDELVAAHKAGTLREVFGAGTAATISLIKELKYQDEIMYFDTASWTIAPELKQRLNDIRQGKVADKYGWMFKVD